MTSRVVEPRLAEASAPGCAEAPSASTELNASADPSGSSFTPSLTPQLAFAQLEPEYRALPRRSVRLVNLNIPRAVSKTLAAVPLLQAERPHLQGVTPPDCLERIDRLEVYALGLLAANDFYEGQSQFELQIREDFVQVRKVVARLKDAATVLVNRGLMTPQVLRCLRKGGGREKDATNLMLVSAAFRYSWENVKAHTFVTRQEVEEASQLFWRAGPHMRPRYSRRSEKYLAKDNRDRAFTCFTEVYSQARTYLKLAIPNPESANLVLESLYPRKSGRGHTATPRSKD